jgi:hypothetical protein
VQVSYKFMGSTPDTSVTIPGSGNAADGQAWTIQVFRGVDPTTPLDVTPTYATGQGTNNRPDPAAITPVTAGAWIAVCTGGAAANATSALTAGYLTNLRFANGADTNDGCAASGYYTGWTSGSYDPAVFGGGNVNAANSWGATTIALRPEPSPPANTKAPLVTGLPFVGEVLTTTDGEWTGADTISYQWKRGSSAISGATSSTYTQVSGDADETITCDVTAENANGDVTVNAGVGTATQSSPKFVLYTQPTGNLIYANASITNGYRRFRNEIYFRVRNLNTIQSLLYTSGNFDLFLTTGNVIRLLSSNLSFTGEGTTALTANTTYHLIFEADADAGLPGGVRFRILLNGSTYLSGGSGSGSFSDAGDARPEAFGEVGGNSNTRETELAFYRFIRDGVQTKTIAGVASVWNADAWHVGAATTDVSSGSTLAPPLTTGDDGFFAPTVAPGPVTVAPPLVTGDDGFFAPAVTTPAAELTPPLVTGDDGFFAPTVAPGPVTVTAPLVTGDDGFFAPTVAPGPVTVAPPLTTGDDGFFAATVAAGATTITAPLVTGDDGFFAPAVAPGPAGLVAPLVTGDDEFFAPTVAPGPVTVTAPLVTGDDGFFEPAVASTLTVPLLTGDDGFFGHAALRIGLRPLVLQSTVPNNGSLLSIPDNGVILRMGPVAGLVRTAPAGSGETVGKVPPGKLLGS